MYDDCCRNVVNNNGWVVFKPVRLVAVDVSHHSHHNTSLFKVEVQRVGSLIVFGSEMMNFFFTIFLSLASSLIHKIS